MMVIDSTDPAINFSCEFDVSEHDLEDLSATNPATTIYMTSVPLARSDRSPVGEAFSQNLLAVAFLDYRYALLHSGDYVSVELQPCEQDGGYMPNLLAGTLFVRLKFVQRTLVDGHGISRDVVGDRALSDIEAEISLHQEKAAESNWQFMQIAKAFWAKAKKSYPFVQDRVVKILAEDESGQHRCVCSFVSPLKPPRELANARFAARFVSLIPFKRDMGLAGGRIENWRCAAAVLARMQGDTEDHALLLCSLLLGWGLDAWVALGTIESPDGSGNTESHAWVATIDPSDDKAHPNVTFWESLTGAQYDLPNIFSLNDVDDPDYARRSSHHFHELHVLFRHNRFLLNIQREARVPGAKDAHALSQATTSFELSNREKWQSLAAGSLFNSLRHPATQVIQHTHTHTHTPIYTHMCTLSLSSSPPHLPRYASKTDLGLVSRLRCCPQWVVQKLPAVPSRNFSKANWRTALPCGGLRKAWPPLSTTNSPSSFSQPLQHMNWTEPWACPSAIRISRVRSSGTCAKESSSRRTLAATVMSMPPLSCRAWSKTGLKSP
jgi:hypothetical protein